MPSWDYLTKVRVRVDSVKLVLLLVSLIRLGHGYGWVYRCLTPPSYIYTQSGNRVQTSTSSRYSTNLEIPLGHSYSSPLYMLHPFFIACKWETQSSPRDSSSMVLPRNTRILNNPFWGHFFFPFSSSLSVPLRRLTLRLDYGLFPLIPPPPSHHILLNFWGHVTTSRSVCCPSDSRVRWVISSGHSPSWRPEPRNRDDTSQWPS